MGMLDGLFAQSPGMLDAPMGQDPEGDAALYAGGMTGFMPPRRRVFATPKRTVPFGESASAVPFAGMLNDSGVLHLPQSGLLGADDAVPLPTARPLQIEGEAPPQFEPGAVPMPQARPDTAPPRGDPGALPAGAKPVQRQAPGSAFLDKTSSILNANPNMLMALGTGLSGAPTFGQGMSRAFGAAIPAHKEDQAQNIQQTGIQASYQALIEAGVPRSEALAAAYNPEVFKAITGRVFGKAVKWGQVGTDNYGNPRYGFIDENNQTYLPADNATKPKVRNATEVLRLPKGTHFIDWNGAERVR